MGSTYRSAAVDAFMMMAFLDLLGRLPMRWYHRAGNLFGWLMYCFAPSDARHLRENLRASGAFSSEAEYQALLKEAICETGRTGAEWIKVWFAPHDEIDRLIVERDGWSVVEEARRAGRPIIFLLPHLGSFHIAMRYLAMRLPLTALYRPPQVRWLEPFMMAGSKRARLSMAPTDLKGVEALLQALRRGEAISLPPDQAPNSRGGVWVDFFGRPAYTATLPKKLQRATHADLIAVFAERLPRAKGFRLHLQTVSTESFDESKLNRVVEGLVRRCPSQYLWSYNRHKIPRQAHPIGEKLADQTE